MDSLAGEMIRGMVESHIEGIDAGFAVQQVKIDAILIAYERAISDPQFKCPSYLMAAIEAARG